MIAESSDLRVFVAPISKSGTFRLSLPAGVSYRITLANTVRAGVYTAVGKVHWPLQSGARRWATVGAGDALDLGVVYKRSTAGGSSPLGVRCSGCSDGDDDDKDDDDGGYGGGSGGGSGGGDHDDDDDDDGDDECKEEDDSKVSTPTPPGSYDCDDPVDQDDDCDEDEDEDEHEKACDDNNASKPMPPAPAPY
jgi:hypothetical protein